jgi:hypothetical protein
MTSGMGRRLKQNAEDAVRGSGVRKVVISGLANDFVQYFASPEEYDRQHYEGGSTLFGRTSSVFIEERLIALLQALLAGEPAPPPDQDERRNGVNDDAAPFPSGAETASVVAQPQAVARMKRASFEWSGGPLGYDRPLDRPFVRIQRRSGKRWKTIDSDLGLQTLWKVDDEGGYEALWEPTFKQKLGRHRFVISANHYRLVSKPFAVLRSKALKARDGGSAVEYPVAVENTDLTWRPARRPALPGPGGKPVDRYGNVAR